MTRRTLVAGMGNVFLGDDGFGVEVARRLAGQQLPDHVAAADFGIGGVHLAYELLDGYDELILVDTTRRGEAPGTVYVLEPDLAAIAAPDPLAAPVDAHEMGPDAVLATVLSLGARFGRRLDRVRVVGCEPADVAERIGLSQPVAAAVDIALDAVRELIDVEQPDPDQAEAERSPTR